MFFLSCCLLHRRGDFDFSRVRRSSIGCDFEVWSLLTMVVLLASALMSRLGRIGVKCEAMDSFCDSNLNWM